MKGYIGDLEQAAEDNTDYRRVLFTGTELQLVVQSLKPGESIGEEVHADHDQFIRIEEGECRVMLDSEETDLPDDWAVVIPAGTRHNLTNIGESDAKLYTIYAPPEHAPDTVHATKDDACQTEKSQEDK